MNQDQKLDLIDRIISAMVTAQLKELAAKLKVAQDQAQALDKQYGKCRRSYAGGQ